MYETREVSPVSPTYATGFGYNRWRVYHSYPFDYFASFPDAFADFQLTIVDTSFDNMI